MAGLPSKFWLIIFAILILLIVSGGIILGINLYSHRPVEISITQTTSPDYPLEIYIGGSVQNPGYYPAAEDDSVITLINSAGLSTDADLNKIKITVPGAGESDSPQLINVNRADCWLLEALPGIGPAKAQAIVDYRDDSGPFRRTDELLQVNGISESTLNNIKDLITVED